MKLITSQEFRNITIRARVAFSICCLENAIEAFDPEHNSDWTLLFQFLWRYPTCNEIKDLAEWHENEAECIPFCILDSLPYHESDFEFISKEQYNTFENLYLNSNHTICTITNCIAAIGTQNLYGGVRNGAPNSLNDLQKIIDLMAEGNIPLPLFSNFERFSFEENPQSDWLVWGDKIDPEALAAESKWIMR